MTKRELQVLGSIQQRRPDVILIGGDLLNMSFVGDPAAIRDVRAFLQQIEEPKGGTFFVRGTPDVDPPEVVDQILEGLSVQRLENAHLTLGETGIELIGIPAERNHDELREQLRALSLATQGRGPRICLHHTPDLVEQAAECGIELYLAGHTHGGQICLPGQIPVTLDAKLPRYMGSGPWQYQNLIGYTSVGVGSSVVTVRFNCLPEITLHQLKCA
jgi:hypothetical protein